MFLFLSLISNIKFLSRVGKAVSAMTSVIKNGTLGTFQKTKNMVFQIGQPAIGQKGFGSMCVQCNGVGVFQ